MQIKDVIVTITVKLPVVGIDPDAGLEVNRKRIHEFAVEQAYWDMRDNEVADEHKPVCKIVDSPTYPALCDDIVI